MKTASNLLALPSIPFGGGTLRRTKTGSLPTRTPAPQWLVATLLHERGNVQAEYRGIGPTALDAVEDALLRMGYAPGPISEADANLIHRIKAARLAKKGASK